MNIITIKDRTVTCGPLKTRRSSAAKPAKYCSTPTDAAPNRCKSTILRLADGNLVVHSPIRLTDELRSAAAIAGCVRFIVAPNRFHHLFVPDWQKAYPDAQTFCAPGQLRSLLREVAARIGMGGERNRGDFEEN